MRVAILFVAAALSMAADQKPKPAPAKPAPPAAPAPFQNPYSADELRNKQAVIETAAGTIVLDLLADRAPNHVAHFIKTARDGGYDGTLFHRVIKHGIIQGGDPLSKDPAAVDRYGTGGLNRLKPELNDEKHTRGAVSAVLVPNKPDSAGTQFFICIADQPALDGQYTVFARVAEGILVAQKISEAAVDEKGGTDRPHRDDEGHDSRQAGTGTGAVLDRNGRRAGAVPRGARNVDGRHRHLVHAGQGARARPQLPSPGRRRRLRRHELASRRQGLRRPDRAHADAT